MTRCSFEGCDNIYLPCSRLTFFNLPKDEKRRLLWIANSGNRRLMSEYRKNKNIRRLFCENHFRQHQKKCQFNRTTLRREAIPPAYDRDLAADFLKDEIPSREAGTNEAKEDSVDEEEAMADEVPVAVVAPQIEYIGEDEIEVTPDFVEEEVEREDEGNSHQIQTVSNLIKTYVKKKPFQQRHHQIFPSPRVSRTYPTYPRDELHVAVQPMSPENPADLSPLYVHDGFTEWAEDSEDTEDIISLAPATSNSKSHEIIEVQSGNSTSSSQEDDKYFVLSLLEPLRKLTPEQRAIAKMNILKYLLELEVGKKTATL